MVTLRPILRVLFLLLVTIAAPLRAQLNVNSAWAKGDKTDFLGLYQGTVSTGIKPEVLLVIDTSMSTSRLMFHPLFPNNWKDETPPNTVTGSTDYDIYISNTSSNWPTVTTASAGSVVGQLTSTFSVGFGNGSVSTVSASNHSYTIGGNHLIVQPVVGGAYYPTNTLIKPDGTEVLASDVTAAGGNLKSAVSWMQCASHMRLRLSAIDGAATSVTTTRDIDFPLFWAPIDATSTISSIDKGLLRARGVDPVGGTGIEVETDTSTSNPAWIRSGTAPGNSTSVTITGSNAGSVRSRYIEWVFVGKDPNSTLGAAYCVPNALPTNTTVQYCIDPASIAYNGANDIWIWSYVTAPYMAFNNKLPNRTRMQGIKESAIKTWLGHQTGVLFAYRLLDSQNVNTAITTAGGASANAAWHYINTPADLLGLSATSPSTTTPLVESVMNAYQQMNNPAAFQDQITSNKYLASQLSCQHHYVIVMTDGSPSSLQAATEGSCSFPYAQTSVVTGCTTNPAGTGTTYSAGANPAFTGNAAIKALLTSPSTTTPLTNSSGIYFNVPTVAGIAAHGGDGSITATTWIKDPGLTSQTSSGSSIAAYLPFWVNQRIPYGASSASPLSPAHPIHTMTVGVSLGVDFLKTDGTAWGSSNTAPTVRTTVVPIQSDKVGSKYRLLAAAVFGDPGDKAYDISNKSPFYLNTGSTLKPTDAAYFFDGRDPSTLVNNLSDAFDQIESLSGTNATASPVFPTIGGGLGAEVYIANFLPPQTNGPVWTGDLLMYPTMETAEGTRLIDGAGNFLSGDLNDTNAVWSAADAISNRTWLNRVIYTRLPATSSTTNPGMLRVNLGSTGADTSNAGYTAISTLLPGATTAAKLSNWQFFVGADVGSGVSPFTTRTSSIMGDIINSSPAVLEFSDMPASVKSLSSVLSNAWTAHNSATGSTDKTGHFRVIFVGTNQGLLHAFGEVSWSTTVTNTANVSVAVTRGVVDELWAFAPTDIIPYIDYFRVPGAKHRFAMDGPPTVYLLDRPQDATQATGNGKYDVSTYAPERATLVFGLGKGGRSYYAINIADPGVPAMQWSLCPDEPNSYSSRNKSGLSTTPIANMGLSTCTPSIARVATSREGKTNQIVDVVLLGGGYSDTNIEAALPGSPAGPALNTRLGRSALAIEVTSGDILGIWDTSADSGAGPVPSGLIPHELTQGTGINQRAYFTDTYGGLWALGSTTMQTNPTGKTGYTNFRLDTSVIDAWSTVPRLVYRQQVAASAAGNGLVTTMPVPFNIPFFPVVRTSDPKIQPGAVGIAMVTGDRNNPLDDITYTAWSKPTQHRLNVLFDRQDVNTTITDTGLQDAGGTSFSIDPSSTSYYLANSAGYFINFPSLSSNGGTFIPKGIVSPLVLDGALFYSYFNPTTSSCAGGTGTTETFRVCNVMKPVVNAASSWGSADASSVTAVNGCQSGRIISWTGVASMLALRSILAGVQAGMTGGSGINVNASQPQNLLLQDLTRQGSSVYAKVRVWRTIH